ncbi:MAG: hypothetical protein LBJ36_09905 [Synergistaceae bacterium]|nr:hypothetical protein [Synergistaceae bacterium]
MPISQFLRKPLSPQQRRRSNDAVLGCCFEADTLLEQIRNLNVSGISQVIFADHTGCLRITQAV